MSTQKGPSGTGQDDRVVAGRSPSIITVKLEQTAIVVDAPAWPTDLDQHTSLPPLDEVELPSSVNERSMQYMVDTEGLSSPDACEKARRITWGVIKIAESGKVTEKALFTSDGAGISFSLSPQPRSRSPLQWGHFGPGAITNHLADIPCSELGFHGILGVLNDILCTNYPLDMPGLQAVLEHFKSASRDLGQLYGSLRPHWHTDFTSLLVDSSQRRAEYESTLRHSMDSQGRYLITTKIYPRRIWDLYSNRVLPIYALKPSAIINILPRHFCTVSHSWVAGNARVSVTTPINGEQWPVPIPKDTTLEHIRVELLNLGFEYAWLDVLCLRQQGRPEDEEQRMEEWKVDVPTLGSTYTEYQPCVTYFNGLGLPFDSSPALLSSDRHWLNRVWTLQEGSDMWLPGGATGEASADARDFYALHAVPALRHRLTEQIAFWAAAMRTRFSTKELDKVHGLSYVLGCGTMPVYDERRTPAQAWDALLKHVSGPARLDLVARHIQHRPDATSLLPSWEEFLQWTIAADIPSGTFGLDLVDDECRGTTDPGVYRQLLTDSWGPFLVRTREKLASSLGQHVDLCSPDDGQVVHTIECQIGRTLSPNTPYVILEIDRKAQVLAVVEVLRRIPPVVQGKHAFDILQREGVIPAMEVIKRGGLVLSGDNQEPFSSGSKVTAVYVPLDTRGA